MKGFAIFEKFNELNYKELLEVVELVSPNKVKHLDVMGKHGLSRGLMGVLYQGLRERKWASEAEMEAWFEEELGVSRANLRKIKRRLYAKLSNTALFLDANEPAFTDFQRAYYNCYRELAIFKVLRGRGAGAAAFRLGNRLLRRAIRFELTEIIIMVARELHMFAGTVQDAPREAIKYARLVREYLEVLSAEIKAEYCYQDVVRMLRSRSSRQEVVELAAEYSAELSELVSRFDSYKLHLYAYNLFLLRHELESNYQQMMAQAKEVVAHFEAKKHLVSNTAIFSFLFRMLVAQIQLGKYEDGRQTARQCLDLVQEGTPNWFFSIINYIILSLHSGDYAHARELFERAASHKQFQHQTGRVIEQFRLLEAMLHYLHKVGKLDAPPMPQGQARKFRLSRFLNEVPEFSKDKRGTNVTILIIQILFLLLDREYELVVDRLESLRVYAHRYLRKDETYRSNVFIKLLTLLPTVRFHKHQAARKAVPLLKKLEEVPLSRSKLGSDIEILPYEKLWEFVVGSLSTRRSYVV